VGAPVDRHEPFACGRDEPSAVRGQSGNLDTLEVGTSVNAGLDDVGDPLVEPVEDLLESGSNPWFEDGVGGQSRRRAVAFAAPAIADPPVPIRPPTLRRCCLSTEYVAARARQVSARGASVRSARIASRRDACCRESTMSRRFIQIEQRRSAKTHSHADPSADSGYVLY
jgi:hypothetical protein